MTENKFLRFLTQDLLNSRLIKKKEKKFSEDRAIRKSYEIESYIYCKKHTISQVIFQDDIDIFLSKSLLTHTSCALLELICALEFIPRNLLEIH